MINGVVALYSLQAFLHMFLCVYLAYKCFESKLRYSKTTTIIAAGILIILSVLIIELFIERTALFPNYTFYGSALLAITAITFALVYFRANILQLMFLVFFLINATIKTSFVSKSILSFNLFPDTEISYIIISICVLMLMSPFMWYLITKLFKKVVVLNIQGNYLKWLFILPAANFIIYLGLGSGYFLSKGWFGLVALLISNTATFLSYVAVLQMFLKMHESLLATTKTQLAKQMIVLQKEQYDKIAEDIEKNARIEHDFRHNLIVIRSFLDEKNLIGLREYLDQYENSTISIAMPAICNNHFVDIVLKHYISRANDADIKVNVSVSFPESFEMTDNEIVVLFGNLFENALESCLRQNEGTKFIDIQTKILSQSMLAIIVRNSYSGKIIKKDNLFLSSKHNGAGIGVSTIRYICEKNGGNCKFAYENGIFTARILIIEPT